MLLPIKGSTTDDALWSCCCTCCAGIQVTWPTWSTWPTWPTWSTWSTSSTWPTWVNGVRLFLTLLNYIKLNQIRLNWSWGKTKEKTTATRMLECFNWTEHSGVQWDQDQRGMMMRCLNCHKFIWEFWLKIQHTHIRKSFSQKLCFFQSDLKQEGRAKFKTFLWKPLRWPQLSISWRSFFTQRRRVNLR